MHMAKLFFFESIKIFKWHKRLADGRENINDDTFRAVSTTSWKKGINLSILSTFAVSGFANVYTSIYKIVWNIERIQIKS